jgi:hypothetical protein
MAHFAQIDKNNVVVQVVVVDNEHEERGQQYLSEDLGLGGTWIQTSYNTRGGVHYNPETGEPSADQSKALRGNYAGVGYSYDAASDVFYAPQPFQSWILNSSTWTWDAPTPMPTDGKMYAWDEPTLAWKEIVMPA